MAHLSIAYGSSSLKLNQLNYGYLWIMGHHLVGEVSDFDSPNSSNPSGWKVDGQLDGPFDGPSINASPIEKGGFVLPC